MEREGRFCYLYSGNFANTENYGVGAAWSDSPFGPFERQSDNPILHKSIDPAAGFWGPGHHSVVEGAYNDILMFYHTKVSREKGFEGMVSGYRLGGELVFFPTETQSAEGSSTPAIGLAGGVQGTGMPSPDGDPIDHREALDLHGDVLIQP